MSFDAEEVPVVTIVHHKVKPGKAQDFIVWSREISDASKEFKGYLGTEHSRSGDDENLEFTSIFRFDTQANLDQWLQSEQRQYWLKQLVDICLSSPEVKHYKSIDYWFVSNSPQIEPSIHKMSLITYIGLLPLVYIVPLFLIEYVWDNSWFILFVSTGIIVLLMSYAMMPWLIRIFRKWLY